MKTNEIMVKANQKIRNFEAGVAMGVASAMNMLTGQVHAGDGFGNTSVSIVGNDMSADSAMGAVIGIILTIMRYVGVAMTIYGVYEIVMSIQNNQPEAKTKGIIMALSGMVMISMKSVIGAFGITIG